MQCECLGTDGVVCGAGAGDCGVSIVLIRVLIRVTLVFVM